MPKMPVPKERARNPPRRSRRSDESDYESDGSASYSSDSSSSSSDDDFLGKKQELLSELEIVAKAVGSSAHLRYSLKDDTDDIEIELKRLLLVNEQKEAVVSSRNNVVLAATAVEMLNQQFGPVLDLQGLGSHVSKEAQEGRYDDPLRRLHRKHWYTGVGGNDSPEKDLAWALIQGAGMYHLRKSGILSQALGSMSGSS